MKEGATQLIFLVSAPRSGSTLLQHVLSNNSNVATVNEPWLLLHFCGLQRPDLMSASFDYDQAFEATTSFLKSTGQQDLFFENLRDFLLKTYVPVGATLEAKYILDKTPRYYEILPFIRKVFPEAKIILLKRNPLSVLSSIIETWKIKNIPQLYSYHRDLLHAPFLMHNFLVNNSDKNIRVVMYEDLIQQPENVVSALYDWLGIDYQASVMNFASNTKSEGIFGDKSEMILKGEVVRNTDKWQKKLDSNIWKSFFLGYLNFLGPRFLEAYEYTFDSYGKKTRAFETYRYISEKDVAKQRPIGNPLTYVYFRSMYRIYALR